MGKEVAFEYDPKDPHGWRKHAACLGQTDKMFPKGYKDISYIPGARALCRGCPVRENCLDYILQFPASDLHGVTGGLTPRQIAAEQKRRGIVPSHPTNAAMFSHLFDGDKVSVVQPAD